MKYIVSIGLFFIVVVIATSAYLSPDDLKNCDTTPSQNGSCETVDAVVAVSGGHTQLRTAEAIKLYEQGWAKYLVLSGAALDASGPSNAAVMKEQAINSGVPEGAILTEESSRTTHQNAEQTRSIFDTYDIRSIILVTSPYHQRRVATEFHANLGNEISIKSHPVQNDPDWPWYWWITPRGWWLAVGELVKIGVAHAGESR